MSRATLSAALLTLAVLPVAPAVAETTATQGVLVLRNGNVLQGGVRRYGDYYRVDLANASFQVPVSQTELFCRSLPEAYEERRQRNVGRSADAHLALARWCLRHDLLEQAAREVLDARSIDAGHPALPMFDSQLGQLLALRRERQRRQSEPEVEQVQFESPLAAPQSPGAAPHFDVSAEAQTQFVRNIQPMLVHSCATGGCHQPDSANRFQLDRWALEGSGNPTLIRRNLVAVSAQVDADDPASSPLIQWARQAHGRQAGKSSIALAPYQAAMLLEWLNAAAGDLPVDPTMLPEQAALQDEALDGPIESTIHDDSVHPASAQIAQPTRIQPSARTTAPAQTNFVPRDPFDPEIFNRRMAARDDQPATIPVPENKEPEPLPTAPELRPAAE
jgi:hypothetical protein